MRKELDEAKHDPIKLQATKRVYPTSEADPWSESEMSDTLFDNLRLSAKEEQLEEMQSMGVFPYQDFNMDFTAEPIKNAKDEKYTFPGTVFTKFITDDEKMAGGAHGRFKWFRKEWTPDWFMERYVNKTIKHPKTGLLMPNPDSPFFIAIDPTKYRISKNTGRTSSNSIQVFILPNAEINAFVGKNVTNRRQFISYLFRRDKPSDTLRDIIAAVLYFGCMVQIESNVSTWATKLIEMGLGHFVMMVNKEGALEPWNPHDDTQNYFTSQKPQIDQYVDAGQEFYGAPLAPGEIDNIEYLDDIDVIRQLKEIRKENTTEYDAAVANLQGQMGIAAWLGWRRANEKHKLGADEHMRHFAMTILN